MLKKSLSLLTLLILSGPILAQAPVVGKTAEVRGLVTVSIGASVTTVSGIVPVVDGSRFVTTSTGFVTIRYEDGCEVKLQPNQAYTVEAEKSCAARFAAVLTMPGTAGPVIAGAGTDVLRLLMTAGLLVAGAAGSNSLVGGGGGGSSLVGGGGGRIPDFPISP